MKRIAPRRADAAPDAGMILVNVLMFVAIASGMVLLLITREEVSLDRALRGREAARALAIVRGGEWSALAALQRDAVAAPDADYPGEAWAAIADSGAPIEGGTFDLAIADAQGRFNVNTVRGDDLGPQLVFLKIARELGLSDAKAAAAVVLIRERGPVADLRPLQLLDLPPGAAERFARIATALPGRTDINLNAAPAELMAILFDDPLAAERLAQVRARQGYLSSADLEREGVQTPPGTGFKSTMFWVRSRATIGSTAQQAATLIQRRMVDGVVQTVPVQRWRNAAIPPDAPPLSPPRTRG